MPETPSMPTQASTTVPHLSQPPPCRRCRGPGTRHITRASNRNGNARRPFVKCASSCGKFISFTDERGIDPSNPGCDCGRPSRRQITGRDKAVPRAIHFVCSEGRCDFYSEGVDGSGDRVTVALGLLDRMIRLKIV